MTSRPESEFATRTDADLTERAQTPDAARMGGNRSARQLQSQQLTLGASPATDATQAPPQGAADKVIGPPLPVVFNAAVLSAIPGLDGRLGEWERLHLKDGDTLTVEERLVLVAHILTLRGMPAEQISDHIDHAFFGNSGDKRTADNIKKDTVHLVYATPGTAAVLDLAAPVPGTARVVFSNGASSSFTGPTKYPGRDTNEREAQVGLARNSYLTNGRRAGYGGGQSMITDRRPELQAAFIADDASRSVRGSVGSPGFNAAFTDFIYDKVLFQYAEKVAVQNIPFLQNWVLTNPAPKTPTPAWTRQLAAQAMSLVLGYTNANIFAKKHETWYVEDEAAAQILVEKVQPGVSVNFDVDAPANIRVR